MPSSVILRMRYEPESKTLDILFRGGRGTYRYFDVPVEEWVAFRASGSKGTYLNEVFKEKNYRYEKLGREESFRLFRRKDAALVVKEQQRDGHENDQAEQQANFLSGEKPGPFQNHARRDAMHTVARRTISTDWRVVT